MSRRRRAAPLILFLLFLCAAPRATLSADNGGTAGSYLRLGAGTRALSLGAFTAVADDASACYWNPAGLALIHEYELGGQTSLLSLKRAHNFLGAAFPTGKFGTVGLALVNYSAGNDIEARMGNTLVPDALFSDNQDALYFSWGKQFAAEWMAGCSLKALFHNLYNQSAFGLGFDAGVLYRTSLFTLGLDLQDIYGSLNWAQSGEVESLPFTARYGLSVPWMDGKLLTAMDLETVFSPVIFRFNGIGAEYLVTNALAVRCGWRQGLSAGFGLYFPIMASRSQLDYAFFVDPMDEGSYIHRFSLSVRLASLSGLFKE